MSRHDGFALLSTIWLVVALGVLVATGLSPVLLSIQAAGNRVQLERARWAAFACVELARVRASNASLDSVSLGEPVWCRVTSLQPDERVNPNFTDSTGLLGLLADPVRVASVLDWIDEDSTSRLAGAEAPWYAERQRPTPSNRSLESVSELSLIRGFEEFTTAQLEELFTTRGDGSISPNRAPAWALRSLSGMPPELAERAVALRGGGRRMLNAEQVAAALRLSPTIAEFQAMSSRLSFDESTLVVKAVGHVGGGGRSLSTSVTATLRRADQGTQIMGWVVQ